VEEHWFARSRKIFLSKKYLSMFLTSFAVAVIRYWIRVLWDTAMFHLVIKNRGRIPASDSFVVKRIAGPGLASDYYYQVFSFYLYKEELQNLFESSDKI